MQFNKYSTIGNNLSQQIDNGRKIKELVFLIKEYPFNFVIDILFNATIVKHNKSLYLKDYTYKGTFSKFDFLDNENFIKAIKLTTRKNIKTIK